MVTSRESPLGKAATAIQEYHHARGKLRPSYQEALDQARAVVQAIREPDDKIADRGAISIANQFTDPFDVLSPEEEEALGLVVDGDDAYLSASERLRPYVIEAWQTMIDAMLAEGEG